MADLLGPGERRPKQQHHDAAELQCRDDHPAYRAYERLRRGGGPRAAHQMSSVSCRSPSAPCTLQDRRADQRSTSEHGRGDLTFGGKTSVTLYAGAPILSDPLNITLGLFANLAISLFLRKRLKLETVHQLASAERLCIERRQHGRARPAFAGKITGEPSSTCRACSSNTRGHTDVIVAFGDSITDGYASNGRCESPLAGTTCRSGSTAEQLRQGTAILNEAISGNRVLSDGAGVSALARY